MNIYAQPGTLVRFANPGNGYTHDQEQAARLLIVDGIYTIDHTEVDRCSTKVFLKEFPDTWFNSVLFEDA